LCSGARRDDVALMIHCSGGRNAEKSSLS
jgi:hypothetical protein